MTRKGVGLSINLIIALALAMIVVLVSVVVYEVGADHFREFLQGNMNLSIGGGG